MIFFFGGGALSRQFVELITVHAADLLVGLFIRTILKLRGVPENQCTYAIMTWLLNPFTFTIGTRGNCEPIVCAMVLSIIICVIKGITSTFICFSK